MKARATKAAICSLAVLTAGAISVSPAAAADEPALEVTEADVTALLPAEELAQWNALSPEEQERTLAILSDPTFLTDSFDVQDNPDVEVALEETVTGGIEARAAKTRSVTQNWTILGISYAEVSTRIRFVGATSGGVRTIENCWANVVNRVPLRVVNWTNYSGKTGANAPQAWCKTDISLARPAQKTYYGTQGLQVNGSGDIVTRWRL